MFLDTFANMKAKRNTQPNQEYLAHILFSQRAGLGCLPPQLGLNDEEFQHLVTSRFSGLQKLIHTKQYSEQALIRQELLSLRQEEWDDLYQLLSAHRQGDDISEIWLAKILATACLGSDHLWRDLGLKTRSSLRALLTSNFATLAERNSYNMRWKKFFYRQLCEQGGHYVCRSPSCETCRSFTECFGDEI